MTEQDQWRGVPVISAQVAGAERGVWMAARREGKERSAEDQGGGDQGGGGKAKGP
jgi:hypothetical protein